MTGHSFRGTLTPPSPIITIKSNDSIENGISSMGMMTSQLVKQKFVSLNFTIYFSHVRPSRPSLIEFRLSRVTLLSTSRHRSRPSVHPSSTQSKTKVAPQLICLTLLVLYTPVGPVGPLGPLGPLMQSDMGKC